MTKITIAPLAMPGSMTSAAERAVREASALFLQTERHAAARPIVEAGISYITMDDLYESCSDFDALNEAIAARLSGVDAAVYAVPGRGVGEAQLKALRAVAEVELLPSSGYAEAALAASGVSCAVTVTAAANGLPNEFDTDALLIVEELDTRLIAGEVKLKLSEYYPDEHTVLLAVADEEGRYSVTSMPLYKIDAADGYFAATVLIVPPAPFEALTRHGSRSLERVLKRLRAPGGCPWDREQTHDSLRSTLIEEAYEVMDAIISEDDFALTEELGDLVMQAYFHAEIGEEQASFTMRDVYTGIVEKLIYRHPHVFAAGDAKTSDEVLYKWEELKKKEKKQDTVADAMASVPRSFPALMRAAKVQKKAAHVGFDWASAGEALEKVREEADELARALKGDGDAVEELGDLLFACVNTARLARIDAELALSAATDKFFARFADMEKLILAERGSLDNMTLAEMDTYWDRVKRKKA